MVPSNNSRGNILSQFLCFTGVGAIGTLTHYATLIVLVQLMNVSPLLASVAGFVQGAFVNYFLNHRYTFRSNRQHHKAITQFFVVALIGLVINTFVMKLAIEIFIMHYLLAQMIATGLVLIWNFTGNYMWTFRKENHASRF